MQTSEYIEAPTIPEGMTIPAYRASRKPLTAKQERAAFKRLCMKAVKACGKGLGSGHKQPYAEWLLDTVGNAAGGGPRREQA